MNVGGNVNINDFNISALDDVVRISKNIFYLENIIKNNDIFINIENNKNLTDLVKQTILRGGTISLLDENNKIFYNFENLNSLLFNYETLIFLLETIGQNVQDKVVLNNLKNNKNSIPLEVNEQYLSITEEIKLDTIALRLPLTNFLIKKLFSENNTKRYTLGKGKEYTMNLNILFNLNSTSTYIEYPWIEQFNANENKSMPYNLISRSTIKTGTTDLINECKETYKFCWLVLR